MLKAEHKTKELDESEEQEIIAAEEQSEDGDSDDMTGSIRDLLENSTEESLETTEAKDGTEQEEKPAQQTEKTEEAENEDAAVAEQSTNEATEQGQMVVTDELIAMHPILKSRKGQPIMDALKDYSELGSTYGRTAQELAALKKVNNASEEEIAQQEESSGQQEYPDPLDDPIAFKDAVLADAKRIVDEGLQSVRPLQAESAEKEIIKAVTPHLPAKTTAKEAIESFKTDILVKMSPEVRQQRIDYYENFPDQFITDISNHAKVQVALNNKNSEQKADTFNNTRKALKNAAEHTDDKSGFNNARVNEEESPEDELLSTIAANLDNEDLDEFDEVE